MPATLAWQGVAAAPVPQHRKQPGTQTNSGPADKAVKMTLNLALHC